MEESLVGRLERWVGSTFAADDPALAESLASARAADLPNIQISAGQGRFLQIMAQAVHATRILEIGTLAGYSTIWLARGLAAGGRVTSLELDETRASLARANIRGAGLADVVDVVASRAIDSLQRMVRDGDPPFDLVFMDADEPSYVDYLALVLRLSRTGTLIVADNVVREGAVIDAATTDPRAQGARRFLDALAADERLMATVLPLPGENSFDGMAIALVLDPGDRPIAP